MIELHAFDIGILGDLDATAVAQRIEKKEFTSKEAVTCAIERAKEIDKQLNAIVTPCFTHAIENSTKTSSGIFAGVPTFIKDLNDVKGIPSYKGSAAFKTKPAAKNDKIVDQILAITGSIILGKTSTSEFGLLPCGETLQHGETRNPWNTAHSTGGSSAGSAALVAAGVVPFAHASDGGGSIRIPASCCGLVGLKPSRGRNIMSISEVAPIDIAQDGIVSRTVRDSARYIAGLEKYHHNSKLNPIGLIEYAGKKRLKIGMFTHSPTGVDSHADVVDTVLNTGKMLEALGHHVEYINNPFEHKVTRDFLVYWSFLAFGTFITEYMSNGLSFNHLKTAKFTKELGTIFPLLSLRAFSSIKHLKNHTHEYHTILNEYDLLLSPTLSHPAPKIGHFGTDVDSLEIIMKLNAYVNFTTTQNITGAPAISLPLGISKDGLPIGVQLASKVGDEKTLLEVAFELEASNPFYTLNYFSKKN
jgi:amidase